jgi:hypothetical protein
MTWEYFIKSGAAVMIGLTVAMLICIIREEFFNDKLDD